MLTVRVDSSGKGFKEQLTNEELVARVLMEKHYRDGDIVFCTDDSSVYRYGGGKFTIIGERG